MGAGKSTVGPLLAERLGRPFVSTDATNPGYAPFDLNLPGIGAFPRDQVINYAYQPAAPVLILRVSGIEPRRGEGL